MPQNGLGLPCGVCGVGLPCAGGPSSKIFDPARTFPRSRGGHMPSLRLISPAVWACIEDIHIYIQTDRQAPLFFCLTSLPPFL